MDIKVNGVMTGSAFVFTTMPLLFKVVLRPNPVSVILIFCTPSTVTDPRAVDISSPAGCGFVLLKYVGLPSVVLRPKPVTLILGESTTMASLPRAVLSA